MLVCDWINQQKSEKNTIIVNAISKYKAEHNTLFVLIAKGTVITKNNDIKMALHSV